MASLPSSLRDELEQLVEPLLSVAEADDDWARVLELVGVGADAAQDPGLRAALADLATAARALAALDAGGLDDWDGVQRVLDAGAATTRAVTTLDHGIVDPAGQFDGLGEDLAGALVGPYPRPPPPPPPPAARLLPPLGPVPETRAGPPAGP